MALTGTQGQLESCKGDRSRCRNRYGSPPRPRGILFAWVCVPAKKTSDTKCNAANRLQHRHRPGWTMDHRPQAASGGRRLPFPSDVSSTSSLSRDDEQHFATDLWIRQRAPHLLISSLHSQPSPSSRCISRPDTGRDDLPVTSCYELPGAGSNPSPRAPHRIAFRISLR